MIDMNNLGHTKYEVDGPIAIISIDRADKANAVNQQTLDEMDACFTTAADDRDVRVIVLRAEGKHFSSGHDMTASNDAIGDDADPEKAKDSRGLDWEERGLEAIYEFERIHYLGYSRKWRDIPKPTIAAVQGACIAGGLMLCWPCDLIIAAEGARFIEVFARRGIALDAMGGFILPRIMPLAKAKELVFFGGQLTAEEARDLGVVNRVVPADELEAATREWAEKLAVGPTFALGMSKRLLNRGTEADLETSLDDEATFQALVIGSEDAQEGIASFRERRKPVFKGN